MFSLALFFCLAACSAILSGLPDEGGKSLGYNATFCELKRQTHDFSS
jgi:hypothetical protein